MRTIDVDHFLGTLKSVVERNGSEEWKKVANTMAYMIETEATLCGKEIVHCHECKHFVDHRCRRVRSLADWRQEYDYCSIGEKE